MSTRYAYSRCEVCLTRYVFFFFNDTATTEIYTLSLHDALPICDDEDGEASLHTGRVVPIYEGVSKMTTRVLRTITHRVLQSLDPMEDHLPTDIRRRLKMPNRWTAIRQTHFPPPEADLRLLNQFRSPDQFRLIFEEFFWLECGITLKRHKARTLPGIAFEIDDRVREQVKA